MRLNGFKINSASEISQGISEIKSIVAQPNNLKQEVCEANILGAILNSLPNSFEYFTAFWRNTSNQKLDDLIAKLMAEANLIASKKLNETEALAAGVKPNKKNKRKNDKSNSDKEKNRCKYCKEEGHWIRDCPNLKTPYNPNNRKKKNSNEEETKPEENQIDFACMANNTTIQFSGSIWLADSGCTHHMSPYKYLFSNFTNSCQAKAIRLADESIVKVEGQGEIITEQCKLKNVLYIPDLSQNLFSISAATSNGWTLIGSKEKLLFKFNNIEVFEAKLDNKLYLINLKAKNPIDM